MLITLSKPNIYFENKIQEAAKKVQCFCRIKWAVASEVRFILVDRPMSTKPASFEQHDSVILALLQLDPQATIRTARATYESLEDFEAQKAARVPA